MHFQTEMIENFINTAVDLDSLYSEANSVVSECLLRWKGKGKTYSCVNLPALTHSSLVDLEQTPITAMITQIHQILSDQCVPRDDVQGFRFLKPLHVEILKLKRKLERITLMVSEHIKILNPYLIPYCDQGFITSLTKPEDSIARNPCAVEKEVLKILASEASPKADIKTKLISRMKSAVFSGKARKQKKVVKTCAARLREIEAEESIAGSSQGCSSEVNPAELMSVWQNEDGWPKPLDTALLQKILSDADAKYFRQAEDNTLSDILNENEITVLHNPPKLFLFSSSDTDLQNEVRDTNYNVNDLVRQVQDEVDWTMSSVRLTEREFYAPSKQLKTKGALELKHFVDIVKEAGVHLSEKLNMYKHKAMIEVSEEEIQLMKALGKAFRSGVCCLARFESLKKMVQEDTNDLEKLLSSNLEEGEVGVNDRGQGGDSGVNGRRNLELMFINPWQ